MAFFPFRRFHGVRRGGARRWRPIVVVGAGRKPRPSRIRCPPMASGRCPLP